MKRVILALSLVATPAFAQDEPPSMMERGLRLFMEGLMQEVEPAIRDMEDMARDAQPLLEQLERDLGTALEGLTENLNAYEAPEVLPNGDIIIRRKQPLPEPDRNPDGSVDL